MIKKKLLIGLVGIVSSCLTNFSSADRIDFTPLTRTIGSIFDPVLNFFQDVWDYVSSFFAFLWDLISGLYYGFNTIISVLRDNFTGIFGLDFISSNSSVFANLSAFLGVSVGSLFNGLFLCAVFYVIFRFVIRLIPFFK